MRFFRGTISLVVFLTLAGAALAASERDHDTCFKSSGDDAIAACTRVIQDRSESAARRASAYTNRGVEYRTKGDLDRPPLIGPSGMLV
jgi:hypothetical protein